MSAKLAHTPMIELSQLKSSIERTFREALRGANFVNDEALESLRKTNNELNGVPPAPIMDSIVKVVETYRQSKRVANFYELKSICYGASLRMSDGWCLLGDDKLRNEMLSNVEHVEEYSQHLRCFQALLSCYFSFALYDSDTSQDAKDGWERLRDWLAQQREKFQQFGKNKKLFLPDWFNVLNEHKNLLTNKPCDRYGADMLREDYSSINGVMQSLGIQGDSWVMQEVVLSRIRAAAGYADDQFKPHLKRLLENVQGKTGMQVPPLLKLRAMALLVSRYTRCKSRPEHPLLRDAAVFIIGNPWLKQSEWEVWVKKPDGNPDNDAREMVNGWLKRQLITDFFELLSANDNLVQRRRDYWLKYESQIGGLWFVLGPNAWSKSTFDSGHKAVKDRCDKEQWLQMLSPANNDNNAFVMHIGDKLVVEFGLTGNACFFYPTEPMPFALSSSIRESLLKIHNKKKEIGKRLTHQGNWEDSFDSVMSEGVAGWANNKTSHLDQLAAQPKNKQMNFVTPYQTAASRDGFDEATFWDLMKKHSIPTQDDRINGDALWVKIEQSRYPKIDQLFGAWGFKYKPGRGWWRN